MPVTTPVVDIVPTIAVTLLQAPPPVASVSDIVAPVQIGVVFPDIATGCRLTVTTSEDEQLPRIQIMVDVPAVIPVTVPSVPTVATVPVLLLQVTPAVASVRDRVAPAQTLADPPPTTVMAAGCTFTVTIVVT